MLPLSKVAELELARPAGASQTRKVEAASGLAIIDRTVYVVADDEVYLAIFQDMGRSRGEVVRILDFELSEASEERKEHKPDLESLTPLPPFGDFAHGGLIALGSGSSGERHFGAFAELRRDGSVGEVLQLDAAPLMEDLSRQIEKLNLEGTAITGNVFRIFQRGNDPEAVNAHIDLDLKGVVESVSGKRPFDGSLIREIREHDLGQIRGTALCFSDADTLPDGRIIFSASAESEGEGIDGEPVGTAIGLMTPEGKIVSLEPLGAETKVEGLAAKVEDGEIAAFMVTDNDDPERPTALLRTTIPF